MRKLSMRFVLFSSLLMIVAYLEGTFAGVSPAALAGASAFSNYYYVDTENSNEDKYYIEESQSQDELNEL